MKVTQAGASVRIAAGKYIVEIDGVFEGFAILDGKVTLSRGGTETVRIVRSTLTPDAASSKPLDVGFPLSRASAGISDSASMGGMPTGAVSDEDLIITSESSFYSQLFCETINAFNERLKRRSPNSNQPELSIQEVIASDPASGRKNSRRGAASGLR